MYCSGKTWFINAMFLQSFHCCQVTNPALITEYNSNICFMCSYLNMVNSANDGTRKIGYTCLVCKEKRHVVFESDSTLAFAQVNKRLSSKLKT